MLKSKYNSYEFTYCGSTEVKDLILSFDKELFKDFIWIDRFKFLYDLEYKKEVLRDIYNRGYEIVLCPNYHREILFGDQIVGASGAVQRIGSTSSPDKSARMNLLTNRFYTKLIEASDENLFEFYRNKQFFEKLLGPLLIKRPEITPSADSKEFNLKDHIILFTGAKASKRIWSPDYFADTANFILNNSNYKIALTGGPLDTESSARIKDLVIYKERLTDLTGSTSLRDLVKVISECRFLISNETGAVHIAAALDIPFICISNGNHYGRFNPYPPEIFNKGYFLYPPELNASDKEELRYSSSLDINSIYPKEVNELFIKLEKENFGRASV